MNSQKIFRMKKTALHDVHDELNAKMIDFAGYMMPVQYEGVNIEHRTVKKNVGVFDKKLTLKAINNIKNLYKDTDYKALKELSNHNLISRKLHEDYYYYKI